MSNPLINKLIKTLVNKFRRSPLFILFNKNRRKHIFHEMSKKPVDFVVKYKYFILGIFTFCLVLLSQISVLTTPATAATIAINKSFSPTSVAPGEASTLTVQFFNSNAFPLTNTSVTDSLPVGMTVANPASITNTCGGTVTATPGATSFSIAGGTVPAQVGPTNGNCSFSANVVTTVQGNLINVIPVNALSNAEGQTNDTPASATLTVSSIAALSLNKAFAPNTINATGSSTLSVNITNNATISLTNVDLTDNLPAGVTVNGAPTKNVACQGGTVATPTTTSLALSGVTIASGATCTFSVPVTSTVIGAYINTIPANSVISTQGVSNTIAQASLNVQNPIALTKSFATTPIVAGQNSNLNVNIVNNGSVPFTNVNLTDNLPTDVVAVAGTATKNASCQGGSVSNTTTAVSLTGVTVASGTTCTFTVPVTSTVLGANGAGITYTNSIPPNSLSNTQGYTNTLPVNANLRVNNPLTINKSFSPSPVLLNGASTLTINFANNSSNPNSITGATITDNFPAGLETTGPATGSANCQAGTISNTLTSVSLTNITIPSGTTCTVTVPVRPTTTGNKTNTLPQNTLTTNQGYTNPNVTSTLGVNASVTGPIVGKSFIPSTISLGSNSILRLDIRNTSTSSPLTNVQLTDIFGAGLIVATPSGLNPNQNGNCSYPVGGVTATAGSNQLTVSGLTIAPNATCRIQVNVTVTSAGTYNNTIPIGGITNAQGVPNTVASSADLFVQALRATKAFAPTSVSNGQPSTLTVTLQNYRVATQMTGVAFTDTFPANLTVANPPNPTTTCLAGTITATAGLESFSFAGGTINGAANATTPGTCTVSVRVVPITIGNKDNTIPIGGITATGGFSNLAAASSTLSVTNDVVNVTKSFSPSPVNIGVPSTLTINLNVPTANTNNATDLALVDTLPTNLVIAPTPNPIFGLSCLNTTGAPRSITALAGASTVNISGVEITRNTTCTITVNVVGTLQGTFTNTIPIGAVTTTEGFSNPTATSAPLTVIGTSISKTFFPSTIAAGGSSTLTVTIDNINTFPLTGVGLTDPLPLGVTISNPPSASTTCGSGTVTATAGANSFTLVNGTVPQKVGAVNGICTFQVNVTSALGTGSRINTIPANQMTSNEGLSNQFSTSATLNFTSLDITVNKTFNPLTVSGGSASQLIVTLRNPSLAETYFNVSFTDNMPAGMRIASPANPVTTCINGIVTGTANTSTFFFTGGEIPPNASCTVTINATSIQSGNLTNTIPIGGVTTFQGARNPSAASATLTNLPGVNVGKSFSPNLIEPNEISLLTITVINTDTLNLTNLSLTDIMPIGVLIATPANASTTCTGGTVTTTTNSPPLPSQVSLTGASLNSASTCTILVNVTSSTLGVYVNQIPTGAISTAQGATNPQVVADTIRLAYRPTIVKSFNPASIAPSGISTATLQLGNINTGVINLTSNLVDNLPTGLVVANPANVSGTCTLANVTATPATPTVTYSSGSPIPTGGCTIIFDVTGTSSGSFINTIPSGDLQTSTGNNTNPASATLTITNSAVPSINLVKRITNINGTDISGFDLTGTATIDSNDRDAKWPSPNTDYLRGAIACPTTGVCPAPQPTQTVEYTIYFLSNGTADATNVTICDLVPANTTFVNGAYGSNQDIAFLNSDPLRTTPSAFLTGLPDSDIGNFYQPNVLPPTTCRQPITNATLTASDNTNGLVVVDVVRRITTFPLPPTEFLPFATGAGTPARSYGFVRFTVNVN